MTMKILFLMKQDADATAKKIMDVQKKGNTVTVANVRDARDYGKLVDDIFSHDKVISW